MVDETVKEVKANTAVIHGAVKELKGYTSKINKLELHIKRLEMIHGPCSPCIPGPSKGLCDCTAFEPKQDCLEFLRSGLTINGIYRLKKGGFDSSTAYCDQNTMGGGWTVIQRRQDGSVDFNRNWNDYRVGFGKLFGEMWIGNENIHDLTKYTAAPKKSELLINMRMKGQSEMVYAKYDNFVVYDEFSSYMLEISGPSGNATDLDNILQFNSKPFSTMDVENDASITKHCANLYKGGWWFSACWDNTYLNGLYNFVKAGEDSIFWNYASKLQPEFVEMKIRRKD